MNQQVLKRLRSSRALLGVLAVLAIIVGATLIYSFSNSAPSENGGNNGHDGVSPSPTQSPSPSPTLTPTPTPPPSGSYSFSFENNLQGWVPEATDLELAGSTIDWSITRTQERAENGIASLKLYLENLNDMGKIWIQRAFTVEPKTRYAVNVSYAFASADWGDINLFRIITGVLKQPPQSSADLVYQDYTGNGAGSDVGFLWLNKHYTLDAESDSTGRLYVIIGVWGVWETSRTYYLDNVQIAFQKQ
jgi:hypothetical protein